ESEAGFQSDCDSDETEEEENSSLSSQVQSDASSEVSHSDTADEEESGPLSSDAVQKSREDCSFLKRKRGGVGLGESESWGGDGAERNGEKLMYCAITKSVSFICGLTHTELPKLLPSVTPLLIPGAIFDEATAISIGDIDLL
ncbi:hypothetical protein STEG23_008395, partial [Scotinomys teguina]